MASEQARDDLNVVIKQVGHVEEQLESEFGIAPYGQPGGAGPATVEATKKPASSASSGSDEAEKAAPTKLPAVQKPSRQS